MKKGYVALLCLLLTVGMLFGCGAKNAGGNSDALGAKDTEQSSGTFTVIVTNASGYIFNELYVSATAADAWGNDHLGSTSVLKNNGSFEITLEKYDFDNFDIKVVDEDGDTYVFTRVPLARGTEVSISFADGLVAEVEAANGDTTTVAGTLNDADASDQSNSDSDDQSDNIDTTQTFSFGIYNVSAFDVYAVYMMPAYTDGEGVDILPTVLAAGESYQFTGTITDSDYLGITEWTLRVVDVDGDESASYDVFVPWQLSYVDIDWDSSIGGYTCSFVYQD